jgi:D-glycero-D-manno-heptose 1,7-bisphosphate phosphatase
MEDSGFIGDPDRIRLLDGVAEALQLLGAAGLERIVVTNQSGVARGFFEEPDVVRVNRALQQQLEHAGAGIEAFYFCSHLEGCDCRKPLAGMVHRAVAERVLDLARSVVFGDRAGDMLMAQAAGVPGILVNPYGVYDGPEPLYRATSLLEGVRFFLERVHA